MQHHKFAVGQEVNLVPSAFDFNVPRGTYRIVRQLPMDAGGFQYRVKNLSDGHERVLRESQLAVGTGAWMPPPPAKPRRVKGG